MVIYIKMKKETVKGLIIGMLLATAAVTIYYRIQVRKLEEYYESL